KILFERFRDHPSGNVSQNVLCTGLGKDEFGDSRRHYLTRELDNYYTVEKRRIWEFRYNHGFNILTSCFHHLFRTCRLASLACFFAKSWSVVRNPHIEHS